MIWLKRIKNFRALLLCTLMLAILTACKQETITSGVENPYTKEEIAIMMKYHGSLVAKFENGQWYCLQGKHWVKINSANAQRYARLQLKRQKSLKN